MDEQAFAIGVMNALKRKQKPREYTDFHEWRADWFGAWLGWQQSARADLSAAIERQRAHITDYQRRTAAQRDYPGVIDSMIGSLREDIPALAFYEALAAYLDAQGTSDERTAAGALADVMDASTHASRWTYSTFTPPFEVAEDDENGRILKADQWIGNTADNGSRHAGALYARMRRIAVKGSPVALDREEMEWLFLVELRYHYRWVADSMGEWWRRDYSYLQRRLHALKWVALIDALEHLRAAELIGDSAGIEAAHDELDAAQALFGGNVDAHDRVLFLPDLTDDQRAAWERWQAQNNWQSV